MKITVSQAFAALRDNIKLDPAEYQRAIASTTPSRPTSRTPVSSPAPSSKARWPARP